MKTNLIRQALVGLTGLSFAIAADAARPLITDDAGVLGRGNCELEAVHSRDKANGTASVGRSLQIGCGLNGKVQMALAISRLTEEGLQARGSTVSGKAALFHSEDTSWALSGSSGWVSRPGRSSEHASTAANLLHTREIDRQLSLHFNVGHAHDETSRQRSTTWGLAIEHAGWGPVAAMGELLGDDRSSPAWNIGLRWSAVPETLSLDIAYGQQMASGRPKSLSLGVKLFF